LYIATRYGSKSHESDFGIVKQNLALELQDVSLRYYSESSRRSLKGLLINRAKRIESRKKIPFELSDFNLQIMRGELVGIVGRNGSGKSTLLRIISGVFSPNSGQVIRHGQIAPIIDIGTGMHPDLTCRQNIYLSNSYFGRSQSETDKYFEDIVNWSQIGEFLDEPFHSLSTGTQTRLAFAIATSQTPDLLLVDEVMSVGDLQFQDRSKKRIAGIVDNGAALLVVSHDLDYLQRTVSRMLWIEKGKLKMDGSTEKVLSQYRRSFVSD